MTTAQAEATLTTPIAGLHDLFPKMIAADERVHLTMLRTFLHTSRGNGSAAIAWRGRICFADRVRERREFISLAGDLAAT